MSTLSPYTRSTLYMGACDPGAPVGSKLPGPLNIMCAGTSITYGLGDVGPLDAYRLMLYQQALQGGLTLNFIGDRVTGTAPANHHRGVIGSTVPDHIPVANGGTGVCDDGVYLTSILGTTPPDILLWEFGTNDSSFPALTTAFATNMVTYGLAMNSILPSMRHVIIKPPWRGDGTLNPNIISIRNAIPGVAASLQSSGLLVSVQDCASLIGDVGPGTAVTSGANGIHYVHPGVFLHPLEVGYLLGYASAAFNGVCNITGRNIQWVGDGLG